ncbi:MAG: tRNA pseudouridine(13) synthase TruD [Pseudomonadota bacterium]
MSADSEKASDGRAWGPAVGHGRLRSQPEDFQVTERLGHTPDGDGEHLWLWVEKRERNTTDVARDLARAAGVHPRQVSFAGLKDRIAVTAQYFSIHLAGQADPDWRSWSIEGVSIGSAERASRKIRRGKLDGNDFLLRIRELEGDPAQIESRLALIAKAGVPNGFGAQRFGRNNLARARALFAGELRRSPSRSKRGFYLSAARSYLFNRVLERRIADGSWNQLIDGDVSMLDGSQSWFVPDRDGPETKSRCEALDIHPSGPLVGLGEVPVTGVVRALEEEITQSEPEIVQGLCRFRLEQARRSLRMRVADLEWHFPSGDVLELRFGLGQGSYATTVLREVLTLGA